MSTGVNTLSCAQAKLLDMVDYLASIGHQPSKIRNNNYWYRSPFRDERTASFKIDRKLNCWYDHGLGQGGDLIDFGVLFYQCSIAELLHKLNGNFSVQPPKLYSDIEEESAVKIIAEKEISSLSLLRYIRQRKIAETIAKKYCKEVCFSIREKNYTAIGFRNDDGGIELRNSWYKGSSSPKTVTTFETGEKELVVFEGFFDFLSYQTINKNQQLPVSAFLVLNSLSFFEKCRSYMEVHDQIHLFLDNDGPGIKWTEQAKSWSRKFKDESTLYKGYKDLNEWTQHIGKSLKKSLKP